MAKMLCSLCKNVKNAEPLDMEDAIFGIYVKLMRATGLSKQTGPLGVCKDCMAAYTKMQAVYNKKIAFYGVLGMVLAIVYFYLTSNVLASLLIGAFALSLALIHYCPPLKGGD
jgi:hypothetical protein